mgnify:FL=1
MDEQLNAREQGDIKHKEGAANPGGNGFGSHGEARPAGRIERIKAWVSDHRRESLAIVGLVAVLLVLLGLTLGWFVDANRGSTVGKIKEPAELKVLGPNATATEQIDLSYNPKYGDTKTGNTVTLMRPFCVQTGGDGFELQLANTTNITGLTIELYKAENPGLGDTSDVSGTAGGKSYSWKMSGTDLLKSFTPIKDPGEGASDPTFKDYQNVQRNARPLYRYKVFDKGELNDKTLANSTGNDTLNFIIKLSWDESAKETDVIYLIARNTSGK